MLMRNVDGLCTRILNPHVKAQCSLHFVNPANKKLYASMAYLMINSCIILDFNVFYSL